MIQSHTKKLVVTSVVVLALSTCIGLFAQYYLFLNENGLVVNTETIDSKMAPRNNTVDISKSAVGKEAETYFSSSDTVDIEGQEAAVAGAIGCSLIASITPTIEGLNVKYNVKIRNRGSEECKNVTFSVYYPENEMYVTALPKPSASNYYWNIGVIKRLVTNNFAITTKFTGIYTGIELCATADNFSRDECVSTINPTKVGTTTPQSVPSPIVVVAPQPTAASATDTPSVTDSFSFSGGKEYGVWLWTSPVSMSAAKMDQILANIKAANFNVIYLTVDDVLNQDQTKYTKALAMFVSKAAAQGIAVDALAGARSWARVAERPTAYSIINFVINYNKTNPKLRGFQFDVEPYLLPEYEKNKEAVLTDFIEFIDESAILLEDTGLTFNVVIPHFYDSTQAWTPQVTYKGISDYTFNHLVKILDRGTGNTILIMAYRNYFADKGGTKELVVPEIEQTSKTKVIVAQETGNVEPGYVTFYGMTKAALFASLTSVHVVFGSKPGFGGVAVHYFEPYLELK